jgi:hypothetical protein
VYCSAAKFCLYFGVFVGGVDFCVILCVVIVSSHFLCNSVSRVLSFLVISCNLSDRWCRSDPGRQMIL